MQLSKDGCLHRAKNRKLDPQTGNIYHMEDNPPSSEVKGLIERLVPISDSETKDSVLLEKISMFEKEVELIEEWSKPLGIDDIRMPMFQKIDSNCKLPEVQTKVEEVLNRILEYKHNEFDLLIDKYFPKVEKASLLLDSISPPPKSIETKANDKKILVIEDIGQKVNKNVISSFYS